MESENSRTWKHGDADAASPLDLLDGAGVGGNHQLSRVNNDGLSTREIPAGNIYSGLNLGGQTRAILGNVFYTTHNNVTNPSEHTPEEKRHESLMNTLAFDRMDFRKATVERAHTRTCQWIFEEEAFLRWRDPAFREANHGFLWIKGKPGSGKSTLMKCILDHVKTHAPGSNVLSFFFNARGESLERSTEGCYRSLLHQMLSAFPKLRTSIEIPQSLSKGETSPVAMLQNVFHEAVLSLQQENLILLIDALDECDQREVRNMIHSLGSLAEASGIHGVSLNTCFASRHYPSITVRFCETVSMEKSKGHTQDIWTYARDMLTIEPDVQRGEILDQMMQKAEGVFMWVVLVVHTLNEQFDKGRSHGQLLDAIIHSPDDLDALVGSIISAGASDPEMLPTLIWILTANPKNGYESLFAGIKATAGDAACLHDMQQQLVELPYVTRFIVNASKGLVEYRDVVDEPDSTGRKFQFIHESIRQHILAGGLQRLEPSLATNVMANCGQILIDTFLTYLRNLHAAVPVRPPVDETGSIGDRVADTEPPWSQMELIFSITSRLGTMTRLIDAYRDEMYDVKRLHDFPLEEYTYFRNYYDSGCPIRPSASILHILLDSACKEIVLPRGLVRDLFEHCSKCSSAVQNGTTSTSCSEFLIGDLNGYHGGNYGTLLVTAVIFAEDGIVNMLLDAGADINVCSGGKGPDSCRERDIWSPLSAAVLFAEYSMVEYLLDHGADSNIRSSMYGSALGTAAYHGRYWTIKLLLDRGADVNLEDSDGCNIALKNAVKKEDNLKVVEMLVRAGAYAKVGSMDDIEFKTPLRSYCRGQTETHADAHEAVPLRDQFELPDAFLYIYCFCRHQRLGIYDCDDITCRA